MIVCADPVGSWPAGDKTQALHAVAGREMASAVDSG
jgi:hypothetical protein